MIGTPIIIFSMMLATLNLTAEFYNLQFRLSWILAIGLTAMNIRLRPLIGALSGIWLLAVANCATFVEVNLPESQWVIVVTTGTIGWSILFLGHYIEGRRPALFDNITQMLYSSLFVTIEAVHFFSPKSK
jgi:uncharacterized membrane protein YGL010W